MQCARNAGIDFALACGGAAFRDQNADYDLEKPFKLKQSKRKGTQDRVLVFLL